MSEFHLRGKETGILTDGKWPQWSRKVRAVLQVNGTWIYIEGPTSTAPASSTDLTDWNIANDHIVGALCSIVTDALLQDLEKLTTAKAVWLYLKQKMHQGGIISKLTALQNAIHTCFSTPLSIMPTIANIKDLITSVYNEGVPTQEEWTIVILLQVLADRDFEWL